MLVIWPTIFYYWSMLRFSRLPKLKVYGSFLSWWNEGFKSAEIFVDFDAKWFKKIKKEAKMLTEVAGENCAVTDHQIPLPIMELCQWVQVGILLSIQERKEERLPFRFIWRKRTLEIILFFEPEYHNCFCFVWMKPKELESHCKEDRVANSTLLAEL